MSSNISSQHKVVNWLTACIPETVNDQTERAFRFLEEALELVQACGVTREEVAALTDYTFNRPIGDVHQEVAGSGVCLMALCNAYGLDLNDEVDAEIRRVSAPDIMARIRAKALAAPKGPLPQ